MTKNDILKAAMAIDRRNSKGEPEMNFVDIALGWSIITGVEIDSRDVALMMAWLKMVRATNGYSVKDSYIDAVNYLAFAGELDPAVE